MSTFINYSQNKGQLCMVLAGYKEELWDVVFDRLDRYCNSDIDICVLSAGKHVDRLREICREKHWSYLATSVNNVCLAQNECIKLFPNAKYIFKIDEDMFVTKHSFNKLYRHLRDVEKQADSYFVPSCIVPMINVNTVTMIDLLQQDVEILAEFEDRFGKVVITNGLHHHQYLLENPEIAMYMWEHFDIDDTRLTIDERVLCPFRFSIGMILFKREMWEMMGGFPDTSNSEKEYERIGLGVDEKAICTFAMLKAMPMLIDRSVLVGHLGYGPQSKEMIKFFKENEKLFK